MYVVSTWNGGRSLVDRHAQAEYFERRRQFQEEDCEYDPEMDGGRVGGALYSHTSPACGVLTYLTTSLTSFSGLSF